MKHLFQSIEKYYNIVLGIPGRTVATTTTTTATNTATATGSTTTGSTTTGSTTTASTTTSNTEPVTQTTTGSDRVNSVLIEKAMKLQERAQQLQETHVHNPDVSRSEILWGSLSKLFQVQFSCNFLVSRWIRKWTKGYVIACTVVLANIHLVSVSILLSFRCSLSLKADDGHISYILIRAIK